MATHDFGSRVFGIMLIPLQCSIRVPQEMLDTWILGLG